VEIMPAPRVLVLYNEPTLSASHPDAESEHDVLFTADAVCRELQSAGLSPDRLGVGDDPSALIAGLKAARPDVVFNLHEGTAGWGRSEAYLCGILELLRLPYTGSGVEALALCRSKPLTKQLLAGSGLPTAPFFVVRDEPVPACPLPWPVIVKPAEEDASVGIDQKSVATNQNQLCDRVEYLRARYGPTVLVEQFIRGREFNVPLVLRHGNLVALPFTEILFVPPADSPDLWPIVTYDAKWYPGTRDFVATPAVNPAQNVDPALHAEVERLCHAAFHLAGCRDYGRVDLRVDESGRPLILEVNPNPCISPLAGLAAGLESAAIPYGEFLLELVRAALARGSKPDLAGPLGTKGLAETEPAAPTVRGRVRVRPARRADLAAVEALLTAADGWLADERDRAARRIADRLTRRNRRGWQCWVIVRNREVVGYTCLLPDEDSPGTFTLDGLVIAPQHRRQGRGSELLRAVEAAVRAAGGRLVVTPLSSAPGSGPARQFLNRHGYHASGEVADYYRTGCARLTFAKRLSTADVPGDRTGVNAAAGTHS
jgi:D-alanine-D-alanine ligase